MLLSSHGASTLGKSLRRPLMTTMSSFEGTSALATDALRASLQRGLGRRSISNAAQTDTNLPLQKTWHPNHGIVFSPTPSPSTPRSLSMAAVETKQDLLLHSAAEDNYVMASTDVTTLEGQPKLDPAPLATIDSKVQPLSNPPITDKLEDSVQDEPPEPSTTFSIPDSLFRAAKIAAQGTPESFWSYELYRGPQSKKPTVHYCKSVLTTERVIQLYFSDKKIIGFDIEWAPDFMKFANKGPRTALSLVQIASEDRIGLFHIAQFPRREDETPESLVAPALRKIMEDPKVTKVGVAIKADCTRLRKNLGIKSQGLFELSHLYKLVKFSESKDTHLINKMLVSLASQVQDHLHLPLFKGEVRGSDWSQALNMEQIKYAASDPYAAVQLYYTLDAKRKRLEPMPPLPWHAELDRPIRVAEGIEIPTDGEEDEAEEPIKPARKKYTRPPKTKQYAAEEDVMGSNGTPSESTPKPSYIQQIREFSARVRSHI
ncbi:ribonuclease H-like protein [Stipitochalara longipes BDJ]|nr:ribonuclease H-like protein [Stipitochalara longipes BDJ]